LERLLTIATAGLVLSIIAITMLVIVYYNFQTYLKASSDALQVTSSRLDRSEAQLERNSQYDDEIRSNVTDLQSDLTAMHNRTLGLEKEVATLKEELAQLKNQVLWYGARGPDQQGSGAFGRLTSMGFDPEYRARPIMNIAGAKLIILDWPDAFSSYTPEEIAVLSNYVSNGGRLILAMDNDYYYCNPPTTCAMEMARNFGFVFRGNIPSGTIVPAQGQASHPIWTFPHQLSSSSELAWDGYIDSILDNSNVKILATIQGNVTSSTNTGAQSVDDPIAIVVNEDPSFKGGKVLGIGRNMFVPMGNNFTMFDNVILFMSR